MSERRADDPIRYDERGLAPCVIQDWSTGEVLTLAYTNAEALSLTQSTGELHLYSRSRQELWRKGETSGNVMRVRQLRFDCDADAVVALVEPAGPACHTGERSCFYREVGGAASAEPDAPAASGEPAPATHEALAVLARTIEARREADPGSSYTARLLAEPSLAADKVREEADEVARAVAGEGDERVAEEAADVLYHLAVLLATRGASHAEAFDVLNRRRAGG